MHLGLKRRRKEEKKILDYRELFASSKNVDLKSKLGYKSEIKSGF